MYRERVLSELLIYLMRLMGGWHLFFLSPFGNLLNTKQYTLVDIVCPALTLITDQIDPCGIPQTKRTFCLPQQCRKKKNNFHLLHITKKLLINDVVTLLKSSSKCSPFHGSQFTPNRFLFYSLQFEILFITEIDNLSVLFIALPKLPKGQYINNEIIFFLPC